MVKCPNCGEDLKKGAIKCSKCGTVINSKSSSSNTKLIIGIVVIIAVIAVVGVFASGMLNDNSSNADTSAQVQNNSSDSNVYWASAKAEKFHKPECEWAQKISDSNKIVYSSREDAIADGKVPCSACNP